MAKIRQILLVMLLAMVSQGLNAQNETEALVQNLQTANFTNLLVYWDAQVEVSLPDQFSQKPYAPKEANELLKAFFNKHNILGFEKNAERKVGNTVYLTGKLLSGTSKFNITLLLQVNKKDFTIVSVRVS
jgi:hypothetical protein